VSGADSVTVARDQDIVVEGARKSRVGGDDTTDFGSSVSAKVAGDRADNVLGKHRTIVGEHSSLEVGGDRETKVRATSRTIVEGPWVDHAKSNYSLTVGDHGVIGTSTTIVRGSATHSVDSRSSFKADEEIVLQCGESRIVLTPTAIKLMAPSIILEAADIKATGDGPQLRLDKKAEIVSDEIAIRAQRSSLVLDKTATVRGDAIKLLKAEPPPSSVSEEPPEGTIRLVARLSNEKFEPYAGKRYELRAGDTKREGTTDGDGVLREDLPEDVTVARVELWTEQFPKGPRNTYTIRVEPLPPIDELAGIRARLNNLGYPPGPVDEPDLDPTTQSALESFQTDNDLPRTGEPDAETREALLAKHGH
jgi:type VI secretion system secreted protein VgrG